MEEGQLHNMLEKFYSNNLAELVDNLDIDQDSQNCYLKFKKNVTQPDSKENWPIVSNIWYADGGK